MSGAKMRCALCAMAFAVVLLPSPAMAQTQQTGNQVGNGTTATPTGSTASSATPNPSQARSGASSWSSGQSSFRAGGRITAATNGATMGGSGQSSWVAGRAGFGSTVQKDGIWRESSEYSAAAGTGSVPKPSSGAYRPAVSPSLTGLNPALTGSSFRAPGAHGTALHPPAGARTGGGPHLGTPSRTSQGPRHSTSGRASTKLSPSTPHGRTSSQGSGRTSLGSGTRIPGSGSTAQRPSIFAPSSSTTSGGASGSLPAFSPSSGSTSGTGTAPAPPPQ